MPQLQRDPDALNILLRNQPQIPMKTEDEYALESMIPEEQLFQAQEAMGDRGRAMGGPYSVASRESLRDSGVAGLRQMFGIQQAKGQAAAYPQQVAGQYGLQREDIRARGNVEAARQKAEADAARHSQDQVFQQEQQGRQQTHQAAQGQLTRDALVGRATQAQGAAQVGREYTQGQINDRTAAKKPFSILGWLTGSGGNAAAAQPASQEAAELAPLKKNPKYANLPFQALVQQGIISADSPDELAAYQAAWEGGQ